MELDILFRSCARVNAFCGSPRFITLPKSELIQRCLRSLVNAVNGAIASPTVPHLTIRLTILDDASDPACLAELQKILSQTPIPSQILPITGRGNRDSLHSNYRYGRDSCPDLIYCVEDDYLHAPEAMRSMLDSYQALQQQVNGPIILHPCDYPDRYRQPYPSTILLGSDRHWRTILHTTGTFLLHRQTLLNYWENYWAFGDRCAVPGPAEEGTINAVYQKVPCFSPMPSIAIHFQDETTLPPFINWQNWWNLTEASHSPEQRSTYQF
ncbi:MAG: glycosyltransferase [Cyanophyceae cyanobacterium]